ncbi:MAG: flagellar hook-length control protein FliK [Pseudomonadota bacterium]
MQISGTSGHTPQLQLSPSADRPSGLSLRSGEAVTATVRHSDGTGKLTLEIGGKLLAATTNLRLVAGMQLQLQVEKSAGETLLRLTESTREQLIQQQALRQTLPRQEPLKPLLERLIQLPGGGVENRPTQSTQAHPPQQLSPQLGRLLAALPTLARLGSVEGLQQALSGSGLFLEGNLLRPKPASALQGDVKNALLQLARSIRHELGQQGSGKDRPGSGEGLGREALQSLLRQVESGVSRIQLNQLSNLATQGQGSEERQTLTLELPLFHPQQRELEMLRLRIRRGDGARRSGAGSDWSVTVRLEPAGFGAIHAVVSLASGKISTTFWCEQPQTGELFQQSLQQLQERLEEQGLEVGRCSALVGQPPSEVVLEEPDAGLQGVIDTRV